MGRTKAQHVSLSKSPWGETLTRGRFSEQNSFRDIKPEAHYRSAQKHFASFLQMDSEL